MRRRGLNVHRYCEGYGIRVMPARHARRESRDPNIIYGGRIIARMLRRLGPDHTGLVLMCIQASDPTCLYGDTLYAVSRFIKAHREDKALRAATIVEFRAVCLADLRNRAQRASMGETQIMTKRADALATLIWNALEQEAA